MTVKEEIAKIQHDQWSGWMEYLFTKGTFSQGSFIINSDSVERWQRQMKTPYQGLTDKEQESDRIEANKIANLIADRLEKLVEKEPEFDQVFDKEWLVHRRNKDIQDLIDELRGK